MHCIRFTAPGNRPEGVKAHRHNQTHYSLLFRCGKFGFDLKSLFPLTTRHLDIQLWLRRKVFSLTRPSAGPFIRFFLVPPRPGVTEVAWKSLLPL